jgi:zinc/manganese transport system permease protein
MTEIFTIMKWPLVACLILPPILVYFGLHVVRRGIIFVDLALAQVAALGTIWAILLGHDAHDWQTYAWSLAFTMVGATIFTLTRSANQRVPQEALIGIVYVVAAAAGILVLSRTAEGDEALRRTLIGEVLLVHPAEIARAFALYAVIGAFHFAFRRQFFTISLEPARATAEGISVRGWDFLFYLSFGFVVTSFVQIGGVLLVFSYLIVPAVCGILLAERVRAILVIGWLVATLGGIGGLVASYQFDWPTGAAIVCVLGAILLATGAIRAFHKTPPLPSTKP